MLSHEIKKKNNNNNNNNLKNKKSRLIYCILSA